MLPEIKKKKKGHFPIKECWVNQENVIQNVYEPSSQIQEKTC